MNKNSRRRQRQIAITAKQSGGFGKPVYKKKAKPFPTPNKDEDVSLATQRVTFYGVR
jgi:ribosomal protein L44E